MDNRCRGSTTWYRDLTGGRNHEKQLHEQLHIGTCLNTWKYALVNKLRAIKSIIYMERVFFWWPKYEGTQCSQAVNINQKLCTSLHGMKNGKGRIINESGKLLSLCGSCTVAGIWQNTA